MYQLTGNWITTLLGGLFLGFTLAGFVRLSLITVVARRPGSIRARTYRTLAYKITGKILQVKVSTIMRVLFILLFCLAATTPVISLLMNKERIAIVEDKRNGIIAEFKQRHPEYPADRIEKFNVSVRQEAFPIHAYIRLAHEPVFWVIWLVFAALFMMPFILIYVARRKHDKAAMAQQQSGATDMQQPGYFGRADSFLTSSVEQQYQEVLVQMQQIIDERYSEVFTGKVTTDVMWVNPPFNTISRSKERNYIQNTQWRIFAGSYK